MYTGIVCWKLNLFSLLLVLLLNHWIYCVGTFVDNRIRCLYRFFFCANRNYTYRSSSNWILISVSYFMCLWIVCLRVLFALSMRRTHRMNNKKWIPKIVTAATWIRQIVQGMSLTTEPSILLESSTVGDLTPEELCLRGRKWWCFLLSSIFTFLAGLFIVLLWRAFAFLCCRKEPELAPNDPKQKEQKANRQGKQEFEGTFMTEAKDWAGELISGQTTTGRILVSRKSYN